MNPVQIYFEGVATDCDNQLSYTKEDLQKEKIESNNGFYLYRLTKPHKKTMAQIKQESQMRADEMVKLYINEHKTLEEVGKEYNISRERVRQLLFKRGVIPRQIREKKGRPKKQYHSKYRYDIFDDIDTEHKAYWLGFLSGDGIIEEKVGHLRLRVSNKDLDVVEKFSSFISGHPLNISHVTNNSYPYCDLAVGCKPLTKKLISYGITTNRIELIKAPQEVVPKELYQHYWRGVYDAHGFLNLHHTKDGLCVPILSVYWGNTEFLRALECWLLEQMHFVPTRYTSLFPRNIKYKYERYYWQVQARGAIWEILDILYKDAQIYSKRKYHNYMELIALLNGTTFDSSVDRS